MESDVQLEVFGKKYELPTYIDEQRFRFLTSVVGATDFAVVAWFSAAVLIGQRLDVGMTTALNLTAVSLGIVVLTSLMGWFKSLLYIVVSTAIFHVGAFCTAIAWALILYRLSPVACWLFVPWLALSVVAVFAPVYRFVAAIMRDNKDEFAHVTQRWQQELRARWWSSALSSFGSNSESSDRP
jgi:cellulose synthase/poly-beta-1,6-N-acetylglucosamine synthase-like glycosyltransferase